MRLFRLLDRLGNAWQRVLGQDRTLISAIVLLGTSLVALLPFSRDISFSNYMIYALFPVVFIVSNRAKFERLPGPDGQGIVLAVLLISGSFVFNIITGTITGDNGYGLTDYVILVAGVFFMFFSATETLAVMCVALLTALRGATLALSIMYPYVFVSVSSFFVSIVLSLSNLTIGADIYEGSVAGQLIIGGSAGGAIVGIGWGCAGLEELVLIGFILFVLIWSFDLSRARTISWLSVGLIGSFAVNILRMMILVWIAYERGVSDMLWVHTHLGDVMFLGWIALFWIVFFRIEANTCPECDSESDARKR